jgi:ATP-binding cassette subfamily F protein uup
METLDLLEECLLNYPGTVLIVSHDRVFLNNVVTSTLVMEGDGVVKEYVGGYDDWLRQRKVPLQPAQLPKKTPVKTVTKQTRNKPRKLSYKENKELQALPKLIETLETEQQQLHDAMADPEFYKQGADVAATAARLDKLKQQLETAYTRWEELETRCS